MNVFCAQDPETGAVLQLRSHFIKPRVGRAQLQAAFPALHHRQQDAHTVWSGVHPSEEQYMPTAALTWKNVGPRQSRQLKALWNGFCTMLQVTTIPQSGAKQHSFMTPPLLLLMLCFYWCFAVIDALLMPVMEALPPSHWDKNASPRALIVLAGAIYSCRTTRLQFV